MNIKYQTVLDTLYIYFDGELDECSAVKIREILDKIIDENLIVKKTVFNLTNLRFMDSTGIGLLIGRYKKLSRVGVKCYIENPTPTVQRVLEISGLYGLMPKIG